MSCVNNGCVLSVIIPVYNSQLTIENTFNSLLSAKIEDMEVVLIDDGSTDESGAICDSYAKNHPFVSTIHQKNRGLSVTRNVGISASKGQYIFFLDSDDTVHPDLFKNFLQYRSQFAIEPSVILFDAQKIHARTGDVISIGTRMNNVDINGLDGLSATKIILKTDKNFEWYAWKYFYLKDYLLSNNFEFLPNRYYEDVEWTPRILLNADSVGYIDIVGINYLYQNVTSILNTPSLKKTKDKIEISAKMVRYTDKNIADKELARLLKARFSALYFSALCDYLNGFSDVYNLLLENAFVLRYVTSRFGRVVKTLCRIFGFRFGCSLAKVWVHRKKVTVQRGEAA